MYVHIFRDRERERLLFLILDIIQAASLTKKIFILFIALPKTKTNPPSILLNLHNAYALVRERK